HGAQEEFIAPLAHDVALLCAGERGGGVLSGVLSSVLSCVLSGLLVGIRGRAGRRCAGVVASTGQRRDQHEEKDGPQRPEALLLEPGAAGLAISLLGLCVRLGIARRCVCGHGSLTGVLL